MNTLTVIPYYPDPSVDPGVITITGEQVGNQFILSSGKVGFGLASLKSSVK